MGTFEQNIAATSLDLIVANPRFLETLNQVAPTTNTIIYTNLSNLYDGLLTDWLAYADRNNIPRETAFYHVTQATAFSGSSPASRPVNWLWDVSLQNADGTGTPTNFTTVARANGATGVTLGNIGEAVSFAYPDRFRELNFTMVRAPQDGWQGVWEYASAVDANGKATAWKTLNLNQDGTNAFRNNGQVTFDPPADWVASLNPNGVDRLFQVRVRTTAGAAAEAPEIRSVYGRDFVNSNGPDKGTIPAFDTQADLNSDGYLSDAEFAQRRSGFDARFDYESRLFYPFYGQMRFVTNPNSLSVQKWAGEYHVQMLKSQPLAEGLFIDNAHGKLPFVGTPVRESIASFTANTAAMVRAVTEQVSPQWVITNTAGSRNEGNSIAAASTGALEEFLLRPTTSTWSAVNDVAALVAGRLNSSTTASPYLILDSLPGSKPTTDPELQIATLAYYYLLADPTRTFLMFYGGFRPSAPWETVWVPAATTNVGQPLGAMKVMQAGKDPANTALDYRVFGREYQNALTLYKPLSYTLQKGTGNTADNTATTMELNGNYRILNADGTLGPIITQISLKNGTGAVLMKA